MIKAIDFFCGAGGLTRGLLDAGINVIAGIDAEEQCQKTYESNNRPAVFYHADIKTLNYNIIKQLVNRIPRKDLLFAGCAPCQAFSQQRKSHSTRPDATLLISFAKLIDFFKPRHVLIENVPGLTHVKGFSAYKRFLKVLKDNSYEYDATLLMLSTMVCLKPDDVMFYWL